MTSFLILLVVATLVVSARLVYLRLQFKKFDEPKPPVLAEERRPASGGDWELRMLEFDNFDATTGPADPQEFFEPMRVTVGRKGTERSSCFALYVATAHGVAAYMKKNGVAHQFGRDVLMVDGYDLKVIREAVLARIEDLPYLSEQTR